MPRHPILSHFFILDTLCAASINIKGRDINSFKLFFEIGSGSFLTQSFEMDRPDLTASNLGLGSAKFRQRPCLFHISVIGIKNKLSKQ